MKEKNVSATFGRREFLGASALSLLGYSLFVNVPEARAESAAKSRLGRDIEAKIRGRKFDQAAEPNMDKKQIDCDVFVAGGGLAGVCAAIAAAQQQGNFASGWASAATAKDTMDALSIKSGSSTSTERDTSYKPIYSNDRAKYYN